MITAIAETLHSLGSVLDSYISEFEMDRFESMRMFVRVAEAGRFVKAASRVSVSTAVVSRAISELEHRLGARLIHRTTRQISLTEAGKQYLVHCRQILAHVELADAEAAGSSTRPSGTLRVHATPSFGRHCLTPLVVEYMRRFPDVEIQLVLAQRLPDLLEERFDISMVVAHGLKDSSLISQCVGLTAFVLCASPRYLAAHGTPGCMADLLQHRCVQLSTQEGSPIPWIFEGPEGGLFRPPPSGHFMVNVDEVLADVVRTGVGIGRLPASTALRGIQEGTLVEVLPHLPLKPSNVYALYVSRQFVDAKVRTFVEFLRQRAPGRLASLEEAFCGYRARPAHGSRSVDAGTRGGSAAQPEESCQEKG